MNSAGLPQRFMTWGVGIALSAAREENHRADAMHEGHGRRSIPPVDPAGGSRRRIPLAAWMEGASVRLVKGDLCGVVTAHPLSTRTLRNINQNLLIAFIYNVAGVPIAARLRYPAFGQLLSPIVAAAAMSPGSVLVVSTALRLRSARV